MTSLDSDESKVAAEITVECSDGVRIAVDLRLFPSAMLRRLAKSEFKDRAQIRLMFDSQTFLAIYNAYLPNIRNYLDLPNEVCIADLAIIAEELESRDYEKPVFNVIGRIIFSFQKKEYLCRITLKDYSLARTINFPGIDAPVKYCTDIKFILEFETSAGVFDETKYNLRDTISSTFADDYDDSTEQTYEGYLSQEFKKKITNSLIYKNNSVICDCDSFLEWFKYQIIGMRMRRAREN